MGAAGDDYGIRRALLLGLALFVVFVVIGGGLWLLGMALGLPRITAFLVGVCGGPLLVAGIALLLVLSMPLERRQCLLGVRPDSPPARSPDDPQDPPFREGLGKELLLDPAKSAGRSGVAGDDDERASPVEKVIDGLPGKFIDDFLRPAAVGDPGVVSQVEVIVFRQETGHAFQDRQSPESGVKKSDHE